ncbi:TetR/AcrR family transcriptional regulator [Caulobacter mirabilis]|uniref:TetR family transcriptional regulator n=1 Tax=Caulobacter mirabilis TaxID=69666 RepID=A0A2D2B222_9CAUL|nr:TetR/AcrR family transcriptional regulator [Caulobacter mirabilis]ATQ44257.1 TetR family transcriptional regulator [Caulobacter mirabilis]
MGRPRAFDRDQAIEQAMDVFWRHGYEGASMAELTDAMGINPPSVYGAFGNKEGLFRAVLDRYAEGRADFMDDVLSAPTSRQVVERYLRGSAELALEPKKPAGCLVLQSGLTCGKGGEAVVEELTERRRDPECRLKTRFERARDEGDLPRGLDPLTLARYLVAVNNGLCVQATGGATRRDLQQVAEMALRAWPGN